MHTESDLLKEKGEGCPKVLFDRLIYSLYVLQCDPGEESYSMSK